MPRLPTIIRYRGAVYRQALTSEDAQAEMDRAITAVGGKRTGTADGNAEDLAEAERPWKVGVSVVVAKLTPATDMSEAFPYATIEWVGDVTAQNESDVLKITALGTLALDGLEFDDQARVLSYDDVIRGEWDGTRWEWSRDIRGAYEA